MALSRIAQVGRKSVVVGRRHRLGRSACETELIKNSISRMQMQICLKSCFFLRNVQKQLLTCTSGNVTFRAGGFALRFSSEGERKQSQTILAAARVSLSSRTLWLNPALLYSSFLSSFLPFFFCPSVFQRQPAGERCPLPNRG